MRRLAIAAATAALLAAAPAPYAAADCGDLEDCLLPRICRILKGCQQPPPPAQHCYAFPDGTVICV